MKKNILAVLCLISVVGMVMSGCGNSENSSDPEENTMESSNHTASQAEDNQGTKTGSETENDLPQTVTELEVCFGDGGKAFTLYLYDNDTAAAIARHVGTSAWRLPIYHYDDYENWEVMQYYDIPSRYEIPSAAEQVTEEKAGTVYYSEPNRIILFYQDAEVSAEYTPVGYFDYTDEFLQAVQNNPVLEGWGNKLVLISNGE